LIEFLSNYVKIKSTGNPIQDSGNIFSEGSPCFYKASLCHIGTKFLYL